LCSRTIFIWAAALWTAGTPAAKSTSEKTALQSLQSLWHVPPIWLFRTYRDHVNKKRVVKLLRGAFCRRFCGCAPHLWHIIVRRQPSAPYTGAMVALISPAGAGFH
jgi:hypothetical protein